MALYSIALLKKAVGDITRDFFAGNSILLLTVYFSRSIFSQLCIVNVSTKWQYVSMQILKVSYKNITL